MTDPKVEAPESVSDEESAVDTETEAAADDNVAEAAGDEVDAESDETDETDTDVDVRPRRDWRRVMAFGVLPALALILALAAGFLKWQDSRVRSDDLALAQAVDTARSTTQTILTYKPDTVEQQLTAARSLLTGEFLQYYTGLTNDIVIPGAKGRNISATATVPAAAGVSADTTHAEVLLMVDQSVNVGDQPPATTSSSVRVNLVKDGDRWLIAKFAPV